MKTMINWSFVRNIITIAGFLLLILDHVTPAYAGEVKELGVAIMSPEVITAKVLGIDKARRILKVSVPGTGVLGVKLNAKAREDMDSIEKGAALRITYYEMVAVFSGKPVQSKKGLESVLIKQKEHELKGKFGEPLRVSRETIDAVARIEDLNREYRWIVVKMTDGQLWKINITSSATEFDELEIDALVHTRLTKLVVVSVSAPD